MDLIIILVLWILGMGLTSTIIRIIIDIYYWYKDNKALRG